GRAPARCTRFRARTRGSAKARWPAKPTAPATATTCPRSSPGTKPSPTSLPHEHRHRSKPCGKRTRCSLHAQRVSGIVETEGTFANCGVEMAAKVFRFGVVATAAEGAKQWRETVRRIEDLGYSTVLTPDNLQLPNPAVALAIAAGVTTELRLGTFVLASPLRTPRAAAWEAHSLTRLTESRFELGLGTGLPSMREQAAELGLPYGNGAERLKQVEDTIDHLRRLDGDAYTPIMVAAGGPKARALAGAKADIVTLAGHPLTSRED